MNMMGRNQQYALFQEKSESVVDRYEQMMPSNQKSFTNPSNNFSNHIAYKKEFEIKEG